MRHLHSYYLPVLLETLGEELLAELVGALWIVKSEDLKQVSETKTVVLLGTCHSELHVDSVDFDVEAYAVQL